jgi:MipA family protein
MSSILTAVNLSKAGVIVLVGAASIPALAQSGQKKNQSPWEISLGVAAASVAEYEGGKKTVSGVLPDFNLSYRTQGYGTFGVGSKSRGLSWTIVDTDDYSFGLMLGSGPGRTDKKDGTLLKPGSKRLRGMGEIKSAAEYGVFGHVVAGLPLTFQIARESGDGKADARDFSIKGSGGTTARLGVELPLEISEAMRVSISPYLQWADKKHTQTYFGVTAAQAARSGFKAFNPEGGLKSVGLDVAVNYKFDQNWSAFAGVSYSQLRGDAAKSPIVQKKAHTGGFLGANYTF